MIFSLNTFKYRNGYRGRYDILSGKFLRRRRNLERRNDSVGLGSTLVSLSGRKIRY
jgi:hypothetical protein